MQCLNPIWIKNKCFAGCVPCGKCPVCRSKRSRTWSFRLSQEALASTRSLFVTLTYNEDCVPVSDVVDIKTGEVIEGVKVVCKEHVQLFIKKLRRELYGDKGGSLRYFACSEYGPNTYRPHYHLLLFNWPDDVSSRETLSIIEKCWPLGFIKVSPVNNARIRYVCKYCLTDLSISYLKTFNLASHGIGRQWLTPAIYFTYRLNPRFYTVDWQGHKIPLHRYYIEKLWPNKFTRLFVTNKINLEYNEQRFRQFREEVKAFGDYYKSASVFGSFDCETNGFEGYLRTVRSYRKCDSETERENFINSYYSKLKHSQFLL